MAAIPWTLECSACGKTRGAEGLPGVCEICGAPYLVKYENLPVRQNRPADSGARTTSMWRYREWLPVLADETPISLGEGGTALLPVPRIGGRHGFADLWAKDEGTNPTGSFKARGLSAAVTRAVRAGAGRFVLPTAGNAGVALSAYAARAGIPARIYAPRATPPTIVSQIRSYGAELLLLDGHIGDCGQAARSDAAQTGAVDLSTLREPYRIEGKKTLGLELAEQLDWSLPDVIIYPTGGGTGLIGMWKAFRELQQGGWVSRKLPRMFTVQAEGCAPVVQAFQSGAERCTPIANPQTVAAGLRVPGPLGDRLMLAALRESGGGAIAVSDESLTEAAAELQTVEGIDASPEGGAALAAAVALRKQGTIGEGEKVVLFNTGAGWLYRA